MSAEQIRYLNDAFRTTFSGGVVIMTSGVVELPECVRANALRKVADFIDFTSENDPYDEHDFGSFVLVGRTFFWRIDYYDKQCQYRSEDPANPDITTRVLTLMLAQEY